MAHKSKAFTTTPGAAMQLLPPVNDSSAAHMRGALDAAHEEKGRAYLDQEKAIEGYHARFEELLEMDRFERADAYPLVFSAYRAQWTKLSELAAAAGAVNAHPRPESIVVMFTELDTREEQGGLRPPGRIKVQGFELGLGECDGRPKIRDVDLAARLKIGVAEIRRGITQHQADLTTLGTIETYTLTATPKGTAHHYKSTKYWLNEEQALFVIAKSGALDAAEVRENCVRGFAAAREFLARQGIKGPLTEEALAEIIAKAINAVAEPVATALGKQVTFNDNQITFNGKVLEALANQSSLAGGLAHQIAALNLPARVLGITYSTRMLARMWNVPFDILRSVALLFGLVGDRKYGEAAPKYDAKLEIRGHEWRHFDRGMAELKPYADLYLSLRQHCKEIGMSSRATEREARDGTLCGIRRIGIGKWPDLLLDPEEEEDDDEPSTH